MTSTAGWCDAATEEVGCWLVDQNECPGVRALSVHGGNPMSNAAVSDKVEDVSGRVQPSRGTRSWPVRWIYPGPFPSSRAARDEPDLPRRHRPGRRLRRRRSKRPEGVYGRASSPPRRRRALSALLARPIGRGAYCLPSRSPPVNLVLGTLLYLTLPSLVIPFAGILVGVVRATALGPAPRVVRQP